VDGLKKRLVCLKTCLLQILGHVVLGFVVHRHLVMFAALFKQPKPAPAPNSRGPGTQAKRMRTVIDGSVGGTDVNDE
jgi:hypothetical protein